ncbi:FAD assembly factor SdhE [Roseomonas elaeocarpi]|uniref:FAD assembly factor SdhE n=1 Tax=Roseomonas elaeocarpi TaxID=907779 RepID=A0ABV6JXT2_9PROT
MSDAPSNQTSSTPEELPPRRKRLLFRAWHRGTKETDLMVGHFVARHIAAFTEDQLDELETVLEHLDVDMQEWLSGRRPIPEAHCSPMLDWMARECAQSGAGLPTELRTPERGA